MPLRSRLFGGDALLERCAHEDAAHVTPGARGAHVGKIQTALFAIDGLNVARTELEPSHYGPSTAAAVLAYKRRRSIVNRAYQTQADDIVGRMTIAALDADMLLVECRPAPVDPRSVGVATRREGAR